jgi:hypothetical protein
MRSRGLRAHLRVVDDDVEALLRPLGDVPGDWAHDRPIPQVLMLDAGRRAVDVEDGETPAQGPPPCKAARHTAHVLPLTGRQGSAALVRTGAVVVLECPLSSECDSAPFLMRLDAEMVPAVLQGFPPEFSVTIGLLPVGKGDAVDLGASEDSREDLVSENVLLVAALRRSSAGGRDGLLADLQRLVVDTLVAQRLFGLPAIGVVTLPVSNSVLLRLLLRCRGVLLTSTPR